MSLSLRASVVRFSGGFIRCLVIDLARLNSRSPSAPWIRPKPESPTPPNGSDGTVAYAITELIDVMPLRSALAMSMAFFAFLANTAEPSAYRLAFASFTASDMSFTLVTVMVGPNVSSYRDALLRHVGQQRRIHVRPADALHAANNRAPAPGDGVGDVVLHHVKLAGHGHRPVAGRTVVAGPRRGHPLGQLLHERVVDLVHDVDPLYPDAGLPGVGHRTPGGGVGGRVQVRVGTHQQGVLAAALGDQRREVLRARGHHLAGRGARPGERDLVDRT